MSGFAELGLLDELVAAVEEKNWHLPRPVQSEAIPLILGGGDVLVAAETAAGKTGAFLLPLLQVTVENLTRASGADRRAARRCVINPADCNANCKISADGYLCQSHDPRGWSGARATFGVSRGKWYYESCP
jgi:ATP-dependent RNA helicase DDX1